MDIGLFITIAWIALAIITLAVTPDENPKKWGINNV